VRVDVAQPNFLSILSGMKEFHKKYGHRTGFTTTAGTGREKWRAGGSA